MNIKDIISVITVVASIALSAGILFNKVGSLEKKVVTKYEMDSALLRQRLAMTEKMAQDHAEIRRKISRYHRGGE